VNTLDELEAIRARHEADEQAAEEGDGVPPLRLIAAHIDRGDLLRLLDAAREDVERLEAALTEKGSAQWDKVKVGILPDDSSAVFFNKMAAFAETRMAEGEQWMTISMKQYAELLKSAALAKDATT
jgi:hypothetical protein